MQLSRGPHVVPGSEGGELAFADAGSGFEARCVQDGSDEVRRERLLVAVVTFEAFDIGVGSAEVFVLDFGADLAKGIEDRLPGRAVENGVRWQDGRFWAVAQRLPDGHVAAHASAARFLRAVEDAFGLIRVADDQGLAGEAGLAPHFDSAGKTKDGDESDAHGSLSRSRAGSGQRDYSTVVLRVCYRG